MLGQESSKQRSQGSQGSAGMCEGGWGQQEERTNSTERMQLSFGQMMISHASQSRSLCQHAYTPGLCAERQQQLLL